MNTNTNTNTLEPIKVELTYGWIDRYSSCYGFKMRSTTNPELDNMFMGYRKDDVYRELAIFNEQRKREGFREIVIKSN